MSKRVIALISLAMTFIACGKVEPENKNLGPKTKGVEEKLLEIQGTRELDSFIEEPSAYVLTFFSPIGASEEDIFKVDKSCVRNVQNETRTLRIDFNDSKSALFNYHSWLVAKLEKDYASFSVGCDTASVWFEIKDSKSESLTVSIDGAENTADYDVSFSKDGKGGRIFLQVISHQKEFTKDVTIRFDNGDKIVEMPFGLIREDFKFADGSVDKMYSFLEYERYFEIPMAKADKSVEVIIPEEASSWIKARSSNENVNGVDMTALCFLLDKNPGEARSAVLTVTKAGCHRDLSVRICQIGENDEGSLTKGLKEFYSALNGDSWNNNTNWCTDAPFFEWHGISASMVAGKQSMGAGDGFVYFGETDDWILDIGGNNLKGTIPEEFWKAFRCFSFVRINNEYLPESRMPDYAWHENLAVLDLSMSFIQMPLSPSIAKSEKLQKLLIQACPVRSAIPSEITSLGQLSQVNMRECEITGELPLSLGNMSSLTTLLLDHNMELGGKLPDSFYNLSNLVSFDIGSTKIGGYLSGNITRLAKLEDFFIQGCEFEGTIPEEFGQLENLSSYDFNGNYFSKIPQFVRYYGYNSKTYKEWVGSAGFPLGIPYYQRRKEDGRPSNYVVVVPDAYQISDIIVNGAPLKRPGYYVDYDKCRMLPFPMWAKIKYGIFCWNMCRDGEFKEPKYPYADDLQFRADEYYYDGKDWCHPSLQYPAREYYFDGSRWVHDASCPWDQEYIDPELQK